MSPRASNSFLDSEHEMTIIESCLTFLATLMTVRTNIGKYIYFLFQNEVTYCELHILLCINVFLLSDYTFQGLSESELAQLEMVTLLCMGDKTHSQLMEYMPEKCGSAAQSRDFETVLSRVRTLSLWFSSFSEEGEVRISVLLIC